MLGASLCCFVLLSTFVAFGAWPGASSGTSVDQLVLRSVQHPRAAKVTVRRDAVQIAQRQAAARRAARTLALANPHGTGIPSATSTTGATQVAAAPTSGGSKSGGGSGPSSTLNTVTNNVNDTTKSVVPTPVQQNTQEVQNQVQQVVNQITPPTGTSDTSGTTQTVQDTAGSVLGH